MKPKSKGKRDTSPTPPLKSLTDVLPDIGALVVKPASSAVAAAAANNDSDTEAASTPKKKKKDKKEINSRCALCRNCWTFSEQHSSQACCCFIFLPHFLGSSMLHPLRPLLLPLTTVQTRGAAFEDAPSSTAISAAPAVAADNGWASFGGGFAPQHQQQFAGFYGQPQQQPQPAQAFNFSVPNLNPPAPAAAAPAAVAPTPAAKPVVEEDPFAALMGGSSDAAPAAAAPSLFPASSPSAMHSPPASSGTAHSANGAGLFGGNFASPSSAAATPSTASLMPNGGVGPGSPGANLFGAGVAPAAGVVNPMAQGVPMPMMQPMQPMQPMGGVGVPGAPDDSPADATDANDVDAATDVDATADDDESATAGTSGWRSSWTDESIHDATSGHDAATAATGTRAAATRSCGRSRRNADGRRCEASPTPIYSLISSKLVHRVAQSSGATSLCIVAALIHIAAFVFQTVHLVRFFDLLVFDLPAVCRNSAFGAAMHTALRARNR